jgi:hypothetical protein
MYSHYRSLWRGWLIAWLYLKASSKTDVLTNDILDDERRLQGRS